LTPTPYALQTRGIFVDDVLNVGIGTTDPTNLLELSSSGPKLYFNRENSVSDYSGLYWKSWDDGFEGCFVRNHATGDFELYSDLTGGTPRMVIQESGNVGIGTITPSAPLEIHSNSTGRLLRLGSDQSYGYIQFLEGSTPRAYLGFGDDGNILTGAINNSFAIDALGSAMHLAVDSNAEKGITIDTNGNVGIGTTSPTTKLHIEGGTDSSLGGGGFIVTGSESSINLSIDNNEIIARNNGAASKLYLNQGSGNVVVGVLEITGGSDLAEPFKVTGPDIEPGMVVVIDPDNPGQLRIADKAYDRTVAGIISGAKGINPGMTMKQEDSIANGSTMVALTGRVYCYADASYGAIELGDMLTTSEQPGYAMKAIDHTKSQGAILGKAMTSLDNGKGLVLVLVTLQ
jgi:hypothetical protein